jgi:hypothetical protein
MVVVTVRHGTAKALWGPEGGYDPPVTEEAAR